MLLLLAMSSLLLWLLWLLLLSSSLLFLLFFLLLFFLLFIALLLLLYDKYENNGMDCRTYRSLSTAIFITSRTSSSSSSLSSLSLLKILLLLILFPSLSTSSSLPLSLPLFIRKMSTQESNKVPWVKVVTTLIEIEPIPPKKNCGKFGDTFLFSSL